MQLVRDRLPVLSRSACLAGRHDIGRGLLPCHENLSARRNLWNDRTNSSIGSVDPRQIAEGHGRENTGSFIQFLRISQGSTKELETHLLLAQRVGILEPDKLEPLLSRTAEVGKMLRSLIRALQQKGAPA